MILILKLYIKEYQLFVKNKVEEFGEMSIFLSSYINSLICLLIIGNVLSVIWMVNAEQISIVTQNSYYDEDIVSLIQQLDETMYLSYLEDITAFGPRVTGSAACYNTGDYIYNEFKNMGLGVRYHKWTFEGYEDRNIEATLPGKDETSNDIYQSKKSLHFRNFLLVLKHQHNVGMI